MNGENEKNRWREEIFDSSLWVVYVKVEDVGWEWHVVGGWITAEDENERNFVKRKASLDYVSCHKL